MKTLYCVNWLIIDDNRLLIVKRSENDKSEPWKRSLPWWTLENDETPYLWLSREIKEELWVELNNIKEFRSYNYVVSNNVKVIATYFTWNIKWTIFLDPSELSEFKWVTISKELLLSYDLAFNQNNVVLEFISYYK